MSFPFHTTKNFALRQSLKSQALVNTKILNNPMHPLHSQIQAKFHDPTLPFKLVVNFTAGKNVSKKAVVRSYARRRTRVAVIEALRVRGYDREGQPIRGGGRDRAVTGSLTWFPTFECVTADWKVLKEEVGEAVERWLRFRERAGVKAQGQAQGKGKGKGKGRGQGRGDGRAREPEKKTIE